jgi:hypothetical protein
MCVPFTGSQAWTRSIGYKIVDEWRPWLSNGQVVGYLFLLILSYLMNFHFRYFGLLNEMTLYEFMELIKEWFKNVRSN